MTYMHPDDRFKILETEAKLLPDQIKAKKVNDLENFIEAERKKYKKTDEIDDLINNYNLRS